MVVRCCVVATFELTTDLCLRDCFAVAVQKESLRISSVLSPPHPRLKQLHMSLVWDVIAGSARYSFGHNVAAMQHSPLQMAPTPQK
jgi:hypothetical protein